MEALLLAFSSLCEPDIEKMGELAALTKLRDLLKDADAGILGTRRGPIFYALLKWFGLIHPFRGQERLDALPAEIVCETLAAWARFQHQGLEQAKSQ